MGKQLFNNMSERQSGCAFYSEAHVELWGKEPRKGDAEEVDRVADRAQT